MKEVFRVSVADTVKLNNKLQKFNEEDWSEQYSDEIFDKMYDNGYDLSEAVDYDVDDNSITFYFLSDKHAVACVIEESDRKYPMRAEESFIGSTVFWDKVSECGFSDKLEGTVEFEIIKVIHNDMDNAVIYDLRKLTTEGGKHEEIDLDDDYIIECVKKNKDEDDDDGFILGDRELSGESAMVLDNDEE